MNEQATVKIDTKKKQKHGKSYLFDKKTRKKMGYK
jgi:hypothetical protein